MALAAVVRNQEPETLNPRSLDPEAAMNAAVYHRDSARTAIYARVSTAKQEHDSQMLEVRTWCQRHGWSPSEYLDRISGSKFTRRGLDALMSDIRRGKIDVLVCYKLDRLGRSLPH